MEDLIISLGNNWEKIKEDINKFIEDNLYVSHVI
jgi:hypothetical protein